MAAQDFSSGYPLPPGPSYSSATPRIDFSADHVDYVSTNSLVHLNGHAKILESTWTIKSNDLWIDTQRRFCWSAGPFFLSDGENAIYGDPGSFDFMSRSGTVDNVSAGSGFWRVHAPKSILWSDHHVDYWDADFTSCDLVPKPHYHFHATKLTVYPQHYLLARNTVFYLGQKPLFYFPFFYKSIVPAGQTPFLQPMVMPGYDPRNGYAVHGMLTMHFSSQVYMRDMVDEYTNEGVGYGLYFNQHQGINHRTSVYLYNINEAGKTDNQFGEQGLTHERWDIAANTYQKLSQNTAFQARIQKMSDPNFANDYQRGNVFPIAPYLITDGSIYYTTSAYVARAAYSRQDNPNGLSFQKVQDSFYGDFQTTAMKFNKVPWINLFSAHVENSYTLGLPQQGAATETPWYANTPASQLDIYNNGLTQRDATVGWQGDKEFVLNRHLSFLPTLAYTAGYYRQAYSPGENGTVTASTDAFVGRYSAKADLRYNGAPGQVDLIDIYRGRQRANSFLTDSSAEDYGVEANMASLEYFKIIGTNSTIRAVSGYNFAQFRDQTLTTKERIEPITVDATYLARPNLNLTLHDVYSVAYGNQNFLADATWGQLSQTFLDTSVGFDVGESSSYVANIQFGWRPLDSTWQFVGALRAAMTTPNAFYRLGSFQLFDKELAVRKLWHDFMTQLNFIFRPGVEEVKFTVTLRFGSLTQPSAAQRQKATEHDWESEWWPDQAWNPWGTGGPSTP